MYVLILDMDIIKNIKQIRINKSITQEVLADYLGVDTAVISNIEKGKRDLKVKELEKISNCLGVDVLDLFTYPRKFVDIETLQSSGENNIKATLTIELSQEKKDDILKLIFNKDELEILSK